MTQPLSPVMVRAMSRTAVENKSLPAPEQAEPTVENKAVAAPAPKRDTVTVIVTQHVDGHLPGAEADLDPERAEQLLRAGYARPVESTGR